MDLKRLKELVERVEELSNGKFPKDESVKINEKMNSLEAKKNEFFKTKAQNEAEIQKLETQIQDLNAKIPTAGNKARGLFDKLKVMQNDLEFLKIQSQQKFKPVLAAEAESIAASEEWAKAGREFTAMSNEVSRLIDEFNQVGGLMRLHLVQTQQTHPYSAAMGKRDSFTNGNNAY